MIAFGGVATAAVTLRKTPAAHKRLMLLATFCLAGAGFGRWWGDALLTHLGRGFVGRWSFDYLGVLALIAALTVYDLITRHRLNKPFAIGSTAVIASEIVAVLVRNSAWWKPISLGLIGH
jgi:hypothetical protein